MIHEHNLSGFHFVNRNGTIETSRKFGEIFLVNMGDVKKLVDAKIAGKKVMVFSKSYCPYCAMAKRALQKYLGKELSPDDYEVMEIEKMPNCNVIQNYLRKITGGSSVSIIKNVCTF